MLNFYKLTLACWLSIALTGCAFHLRGHEPLPAQLQNLYLQTDAPYSDFSKQLRAFLLASHVTLTEQAGAAPLTLQILSATSAQQLTGSGASGQTNTYLLQYNVVYQLVDQRGQVVQSPQTISTSRNYSVTSNQVLGDTNLQTALLSQMQRDVIYQLINRLSTSQTRKALTAHGMISANNPSA